MKRITLATYEQFWSKDHFRTAFDQHDRPVSRAQLLQLQLLQAYGAAE